MSLFLFRISLVVAFGLEAWQLVWDDVLCLHVLYDIIIIIIIIIIIRAENRDNCLEHDGLLGISNRHVYLPKVCFVSFLIT